MGPMKIKESGSYRVFKVFNAIIDMYPLYWTSQ